MNTPQPLWDVFHSERLEAEKSLTSKAVLEALAQGRLNHEDLVRPAGDTRWIRIGDSLEFGPEGTLTKPDLEGEFPVAFDSPGPASFELVDDDVSYGSLDRDALRDIEDDDQGGEFELHAKPEPEVNRAEIQESRSSARPILPDEETQAPILPELDEPVEFEVVYEDDEEVAEIEVDPQEEDDDAASFTLSRNAAETVEELDLAAMVDVAFQLVLFFLVTAQVVLFKTLEIPRPNEDKPPEAAAQARSKSVDELEKDYILVEVDAAGTIKVDHQPVAANRAILVETLRTTREKTSRSAMLLSADFATQHKNAVLVFDVASEIELKIAIAQPAAKK